MSSQLGATYKSDSTPYVVPAFNAFSMYFYCLNLCGLTSLRDLLDWVGRFEGCSGDSRGVVLLFQGSAWSKLAVIYNAWNAVGLGALGVCSP